MSCKPITQKAKSSPMKMNAALVQNNEQTHRGFIDVAGAMGSGMEEAQEIISPKSKQTKKAE